MFGGRLSIGPAQSIASARFFCLWHSADLRPLYLYKLMVRNPKLDGARTHATSLAAVMFSRLTHEQKLATGPDWGAVTLSIILVILLAICGVLMSVIMRHSRVITSSREESQRVTEELKRVTEELKGCMSRLDAANRDTALLAKALGQLQLTVFQVVEKLDQFSTGELDQLDSAMRTLVAQVLTNLGEFYSDDNESGALIRVQRGSVLIPDKSGEWLEWYTDTGFNPTERSNKYRIGHVDEFKKGDADTFKDKRGVAGTVFLTDQPKVCHMNGIGARDCPEYVTFTEGGRPRKTFASFLAVPLSSGYVRATVPPGSGNIKHGVLCLDSNGSETFDGDPLLEMNPSAAWPAFAIIGVVYQLLEQRKRMKDLRS